MTVDVRFDVGALRTAIQHEYEDLAVHPEKGRHFHTGRVATTRLGYPADWTDAVPEAVIESFAGIGNPFSWGDLQPGESVADLGCGAGFDSLLAAGMVGESGAVTGIDMTAAMLEKARQNAELMAMPQVRFVEGFLEALPLVDQSVDVVISNGVFNLTADKALAFKEAYRVLKPGGRLQISDIVLEIPLEESDRANIDLWTG